MTYKINEQKYRNRLATRLLYNEAGKITQTRGTLYEAHLPGAAVGSLCEIIRDPRVSNSQRVEAEVIGFNEKRVQLMPFVDMAGVNKDSQVVLKEMVSSFTISDAFLGRVIDARGRPIDGKGPIDHGGNDSEDLSLYQPTLDPLSRPMVENPLDLGIRSINGLITFGKGQRMGIMAGSGVGKSVLMGMAARYTVADINVIALIGERGREVKEFIERDLGPEGLKRSVVVVATSDTAPLLRMRGAFLATSIAEFFRAKKKHVLLMMDSLTRFCMAQREIGLSMGEPPAQKGYTPSVFSTLPKLLERAGLSKSGGSITGLYTVLVEGDDVNDPIADSARAILDGHIVLSRRLAEINHFPAVDVLQSVSRVMTHVVSQDHLNVSRKIREWLSIYEQSRDMIEIGAYVRGTNPRLDQAILVHEKIKEFLRQDVPQSSNFQETIAQMKAIFAYAQANSAEAQRQVQEQAQFEAQQAAQRIPFS